MYIALFLVKDDFFIFDLYFCLLQDLFWLVLRKKQSLIKKQSPEEFYIKLGVLKILEN